MIKIGFACDHAGFDLKEKLKKYLKEKYQFEVIDFGCNSIESCDYPDYAHLLAKAVENGTCDTGIGICGSGNGINMTMNKYQKIRAALCWTEKIAILARSHNDANICSLPARFICETEAILIIDAFLNTKFEGERHLQRINKIAR